MTVPRLRTVSSAAPASAASASDAPAPTRALAQSNPSSELLGELETSVGVVGRARPRDRVQRRVAGAGARAVEPLGSLAGGAIESTDE